MTILVTGATGLLGRRILPTLESSGATVHTTSTSPLQRRHHHHHVVDLTDPGATAKLMDEVRPDVVIHLAGGNPPNRDALYLGNVLTTVNLFQAVETLGFRPYMVVAGSAAEYGETDAEAIDESTPLHPVSEYGRAKAAQTRLARAMAVRAGIRLTVVRPFNIVAPDSSTGAVSNIRDQLLAQSGPHRRVRCGRLDVIRDYVSIDIVAEAFARLAERPSDFETVDVCSGIGIRLGDIAEAMATQLGVTMEVEFDPELVALPAAHRVVGNATRLRALLEHWSEQHAADIARVYLDTASDRDT